jgi:hypothetical protein
MSENLVIQRPFLQFITTFSGFNMGEMIWEQYQQFAIPKMENAIQELRKTLDIIPTFTPEEAKSQLNIIKLVLPQVDGVRSKLEPITDVEFAQFKSVSLSFFSLLEQIERELQKAAAQQDSTRAVFHHMTRTRKNPAISKYL